MIQIKNILQNKIDNNKYWAFSIDSATIDEIKLIEDFYQMLKIMYEAGQSDCGEFGMVQGFEEMFVARFGEANQN